MDICMFKDKRLLYSLYFLLIGVVLFIFLYLLVTLFPLYSTLFSFLWKLFLPFIFACLIAYLLFPIIDKLHSYNVHKGFTVILIYVIFLGGTAGLIYLLYPAIVHQLRDLNNYLPQLIAMYEDVIYQVYESTSLLPEAVHDQFDRLINKIESSLENILGKLVGGFTRVFDLIIFISVVPVLIFYFLKDYTKIKSYLTRFIPRKYRRYVRTIMQAVDQGLGNYIRGQLLVSLFVSLMTLIIFELLQVKYALLLAIIMGLTNIIPYFGPLIGSIPAIAITITESTQLVLLTLGATFLIQLIENNLISPYIVGKSINIHPVAIIFVLLLGGQVGGIIGMIIAVPSLTIINIIVSHILIFRKSH